MTNNGMTGKPYVIVTGDILRTGGQDMANYALARYLADRNASVRVVTHRLEDDLRQRREVVSTLVYKPLGSTLLAEPLLAREGRLAARAAGPLARVIVNGGNCRWPDVNWVHYVHSAYKSTSRAGAFNSVKAAIVHQVHLAAERRALSIARLVIVNSRKTRDDVLASHDVNPDRVKVVYYGIDPTQFYPATEAEREQIRNDAGWKPGVPTVAFIGGLGDRRKGFDTVFEAWCSQGAQWDAQLVVIGQGAELEMWKRRAAERGGEQNIRFLGFRSDVPRLLRACDALVAPTRYEAYGLGVHEALCCGLQAFVSADAGVAERYPSNLQDLLLPDRDDAADLATRLAHWRDNMAAYRSRVGALSALLRQRSWDDMAEELLRVVD